MDEKKNKRDKTTVSSTDMEQTSCNESLAEEKSTAIDTPVSLHIHSRRKREVDADGVSAKAAIDGLVHAGLLQDDSPKFVKEVSYSQEKIKKDEQEETIIEVWVDE